jgi:preprotein translocase subunit SecG
MTYLLIILLAILLIAGILFLVFVGRIMVWTSQKFGGVGSADRTIALLKSPLGKTFLWRQRIRGIFYIMLVLYVLIAFTAPKIINYIPWYILVTPIVLAFILNIIMLIYSRKARIQDYSNGRMTTQKENNNLFRMVKFLQGAFFVIILIYAAIIYGWSGIRLISGDLAFSKYALNTIIAVLAVLGILCLVYGYFQPGLAIKRNEQKPQTQLPTANGVSFGAYIIRATMFMAVAIYGLILGIFGAAWWVTLPFFIAPAFLLIFTFPTRKRWERILEKPN